MTVFLLVKLVSAIVSVALAAGILARDHGLLPNRLISAFLFCNAWWAICEFFLYQTVDPQVAAALYRAMSFGWMPLGVLCAHASASLAMMEDHPVERLIVPCYVAVALLLPIAVFSDWVITGAEPTRLGWRPNYGPGMIVAYASMAAPMVGVLVSWRSVLRLADANGQVQLARVIFFGITAALVAGTATAVALPLAGIDSVGITTSLVALVGLASALTLRRFGHSLITSEAFAREILDNLPDGVILVGLDGTLRDANQAFVRMVGVREVAALGRPVSDWIPDLAERPGSYSSPRFIELATRTGDRVPIVASRPVACRGGGRLVGRAFVLRDQREIVALQRQLRVSARLAAVGDLSKAIAESISEPVRRAREEFEGLGLDWETLEYVLELAELEDEAKEAIEEGQELIGECVEGADRISSIVREVAGFSSENEARSFDAHDLGQIVARAIRVVRVQAPEGLEIEARLDPDVTVHCHFADLERVVTNLLANSIHALDGRAADDRHLVVAVAAQEDRALLHVEDNGCGIETGTLDRIFDPFFTTKPVGKGTGLGLAISYHIVKAHGGDIRVSSVPGQGTSVAVDLPRVSGGIAASAPDAGGRSTATG